MRPATARVPKALLPVRGEPFALHQIRWLAGEGVTDVVFSIGYLGEMMRDALGDRDDLGCRIRFVDEGESRLGTGGAVRRAVDTAAIDGAFFVLYGDSYLRLELAAVAAHFDTRPDAEALMTVFANDDRWGPSNAAFDGRWVQYDKRVPTGGMRYIDYGLSILRSHSVRARLPRLPDVSGRADGAATDLADMMHAISLEGRLAGYEARERFYEIGSPSGLAELEAHMASLA
jgi:NDP-sugar pyrophosphorylase family protein